MIVKNEEKNLLRSLPILNKFIGNDTELIIIDTGSSDRSQELARKYTDKVFSYEWKDDFSSARNYSISKASKDWILILDADEIPLFSPNELEKIINSMKKRSYNSCTFFIKFVHSNNNFTFDRQIRLFKKSDFVYEGRIFNRLKGKQKLASSNLTIENYGNYGKQDSNKIENDIRILEQILEKENNLFYKFQLLNRYFDLKDYKKVLKLSGEFISYLKTSKKINPLYLKAFVLAGKSANELKNYDQALMLYQIVIKYYPKFLDAYLFMAETYSKKEDYSNSIDYLKKYLDLYTEITSNIFDPTLPPIDTLSLKLDALRGLLDLLIREKRSAEFRKYLKDYILLEKDTQRLVKIINSFPPYPELLKDVVLNTKQMRMALYALHIYATRKIKPRNYKNHMILLYENTERMTPYEIVWFANIMKELAGKEKAIEIYEKYLNECTDSQKSLIIKLIDKEKNSL
jgi:glycosyltransferase involved in cell wall biosynthesis